MALDCRQTSNLTNLVRLMAQPYIVIRLLKMHFWTKLLETWPLYPYWTFAALPLAICVISWLHPILFSNSLVTLLFYVSDKQAFCFGHISSILQGEFLIFRNQCHTNLLFHFQSPSNFYWIYSCPNMFNCTHTCVFDIVSFGDFYRTTRQKISKTLL